MSDKLLLQIKEKLVTRSRQSSEVTILIDCSEELFRELFDCDGPTCIHPTNKELEPILGKNWWIRIINKYGESCVTIDKSVFITLKRRQPVIEYVKENQTLIELQRERTPYLYFSFVRKSYPHNPLEVGNISG